MSGRYLAGEPVEVFLPVVQHDSFAFRVDDGYQARCACGQNGPVREEATLEKSRRAANADASKHNGEAEYR